MPRHISVSRKLSKFSFRKSMKKNWLVCREISDFGIVCRGSKSFGGTALKQSKEIIAQQIPKSSSKFYHRSIQPEMNDFIRWKPAKCLINLPRKLRFIDFHKNKILISDLLD